MKAKIGFALVAAMGAVLTAGCSPSNTTDTEQVSGTFNVTQVDVNGKKVTCITWADTKKGGLSCDWANAK